MMMRKYARAAEESGKHNVAPGGVRRARRQQIRGDDPQQRTQFEDVPSFTPQDGNRRAVTHHGIALASDRLDQSRFAASVGTKYANMLAGTDAQRHAIQRRPLRGLPTDYGDILQSQERGRRGHLGFRQDGNYILTKRK